MKKILTIALCALMLLSALAGCSAAPADDGAGKLILATSADYPPFEFHMLNDKGEDTFSGIDIAVAKEIAKDMGLELEIVDISFDNLLTALDKGECDIVLAAMEANEERELSADFSEVYYDDLPPVVLTKAANAGKFKDLASFAGQTVGAQSGTTKADIVKEQMPDAELLSLSTVTDLVNNLVYDKCAAVVLDGAVAAQYAASNPELAICEAVALGEVTHYSVAVKNNDPKGLLEAINKTVARITSDGTMKNIIAEAELNKQFAVEG